MKIIYPALISFFLIACTQQEKRSEEIPGTQKALFFIKDHKTQFTHRNLRSFPKNSVQDLNGYNGKSIDQLHTPILRGLYLEVFQDAARIDTIAMDNVKVLYSIQQENGHQGILIAGMDDSWVDKIEYRSYDMNGKFIDSAVLYEQGGDGGYYTYGYGEFVNDTTYVKYRLDCELPEDENGKEKCDSTRKVFYIHSNGRIEYIK